MYSGKSKIELCKQLGKDWQDLVDYFEIPQHERSQFEKGRECQGIWEWLKIKHKLHELSEALKFLKRDDLLSLFEEKENDSSKNKANPNNLGNTAPPKPKKSPEIAMGQNQRKLLTWLREEWMGDGPNVCFIEGFSGVGKTRVARALSDSIGVTDTTVVKVDMPEMETNSIDDLLLDLASDLELNNHHQLADAVNKGEDLLKTFEQFLFLNPVLIIIDEFQRALMPNKAIPIKKFAGFLEKLGRRSRQQGRLLLLCNRSMERGQWLENHKVRTLSGLMPTEAEKLLGDLLEEKERADEVPLVHRQEVVKALAYNPRALGVFVECLRREPLNDLLGAIPDLWSVDDREISADLLHDLEKALLERTLVHLNEETRLFLENIVVYRKSVKQKAFKKMADNTAKVAQCRNELIDRFLIELHKDWYSLNPVVREIVLHRLNEQALRRAHSLAADYYTRHFLAEQVVKTGGELGGHFVEARFHLVRAGREEVLQTISTSFEQYLRTTILSTSRPPQNEMELNERIALLSGLLEHGGSKGWEYHLARCYQARHYQGDIEKALQHLRKATGSHAPEPTWRLRVVLENEVYGVDKALTVVKEGIRQIPVNMGVIVLYQKGGEILANANRIKEAIDLLRDGIHKIPADKNLFSLYQSCSEMLARDNRIDEAIDLLRDGINKIPADKNLFSLYQSCSEMLARDNRIDEAIDLLRDGINKIPADKGLVNLYQSCSEMLARTERPQEAIELLRKGMQAIPVGKREYLVNLAFYLSAAEQDIQTIEQILAGQGKDAVEPRRIVLGQILQLQLKEQWQQAAKIAQIAREKFPIDIELASQEAFSWLCANEAKMAQQALERFPNEFKQVERTPVKWLQAFIALKQDNLEAAQEFLAIYLNQPLNPDEPINEMLLLRLWDEDAMRGGGSHPAFYFPHLPPSLTGLPQTVTRKEYGPSALALYTTNTSQ
ncbi:AAA family ATPase [Candidatus Parabeggiatoa sp. HSG14]|uniref:tetratricopeptide repeat protein n=1 Tax=Candidatus Parabeggiatoa sp. HSG14 TaxID=3055593 RepID=UPI0025A78828|nr:AAA family ATPase [Thiotrichales bacterium HSG14]